MSKDREDQVKLSRKEWIKRYGGQELLDSEGFDVVECVGCTDHICHGWKIVPTKNIDLVPHWARYRRVDEVIECMDVKKETVTELLEKMPDAYGGEAPGEDDFPEPDASRDAPYKLSVVWSRLSEAARRDLHAAWEK